MFRSPSFRYLQLLRLIRCHHCQGFTQTYKCDIDAEPLHRYRPGGYHPVALGDSLKDDRYKVLHKLGWGGYSTTWAAEDKKEGRYVAVKIKMPEARGSGELDILRALSTLPANHPGSSHVNRMLDCFTLVGPNGSHDCLVLELVGPNVADTVDLRCKDDRLPFKLSKSFSLQTLQGLDLLAAHRIAHEDLHTRNLAIDVPGLDSLSEEHFIARLGQPGTSAVTKADGGPLPLNVPTHITRPAFFRRSDTMLPNPSIKIIDFGEAFFGSNPPNTLHTPSVFRALEVVFGDRLDRRVDIWSAGCLIFELITGQPPFDSFMVTPSNLIGEMMELASDELPLRWQAKWQSIQEGASRNDETYTLQKWLREVYFNNNKHAELTKEDLTMIGDVIGSMLKFEPSARVTPSEALAHDWFTKGSRV